MSAAGPSAPTAARRKSSADPFFVDRDLFRPLPKPGPDDWLSSHKEEGQTFTEWQKRWRKKKTGSGPLQLYIQPLGELTGLDVNDLRELLSAFFDGASVVVADPLPLEGLQIRSRINEYSNQKQLLCGDVFAVLRARRPKGAAAVLGVTMVDLYPSEAWNFVFGQAVVGEGIGAFSFARYGPPFEEAAAPGLLLRRSFKVAAHEMCHLLGLKHCVAGACAMNGSNHLNESDARPLFLCPADLRKLQAALGFEPAARYRRLLAALRARPAPAAAAFEGDVRWLERRIASLEPAN